MWRCSTALLFCTAVFVALSLVTKSQAKYVQAKRQALEPAPVWLEQVQVLQLRPSIIANDGNTVLQADLQAPPGCQQDGINSFRLKLSNASRQGGTDISIPGSFWPGDCSSLTFRTTPELDIAPGVYEIQIYQGATEQLRLQSPQLLTVVDAASASIVGQTVMLYSNRAALQVAVVLDAIPRLPATVGLQLPPTAGVSVHPPMLTWRAGEAGEKRFTLQSSLSFSQPLLVSLQPISNVVLAHNSGSGAGANDSVLLKPPWPRFYYVASQAVYPSATSATQLQQQRALVRLPVRRLDPSPFASSLSYIVTLLNATGCSANDSCISVASGSGVLSYTSADDVADARIYVNWTAMPARAALRFGLQLTGVRNAVALPQSGATALFVYGTVAGVCPPGTAGPWRSNASTLMPNKKGPPILPPLPPQPLPKGVPAGDCMGRCSDDNTAALLDSGLFNNATLMLTACSDGEATAWPPMAQPAADAPMPSNGTMTGNSTADGTALDANSRSGNGGDDSSSQRERLPLPYGQDLIRVCVRVQDSQQQVVPINSTCAQQATWLPDAEPGSADGSDDSGASGAWRWRYCWRVANMSGGACTVVAGIFDTVATNQQRLLQQQPLLANSSGGNSGSGNATSNKANGSTSIPGNLHGVGNASTSSKLPPSPGKQPDPGRHAAGALPDGAQLQGDSGSPAAGLSTDQSQQLASSPPAANGSGGGVGENSNGSGSAAGGAGGTPAAVTIVSMLQKQTLSITLLPLSDPRVFDEVAIELVSSTSNSHLVLCGMPLPLLTAAAMQLYGAAFNASHPSEGQLQQAAVQLALAIRGNPTAARILQAGSPYARQDAASASPPPSPGRSGGRRRLSTVAALLPLALGHGGRQLNGATAIPAPDHVSPENDTQTNTSTAGTGTSPTPSGLSFGLPARSGPSEYRILVNPQYVEWCDLASPQPLDLQLLDMEYELAASSGSHRLELQPASLVVSPTLREQLRQKVQQLQDEARRAAAAAAAASPPPLAEDEHSALKLPGDYSGGQAVAKSQYVSKQQGGPTALQASGPLQRDQQPVTATSANTSAVNGTTPAPATANSSSSGSPSPASGTGTGTAKEDGDQAGADADRPAPIRSCTLAPVAALNVSIMAPDNTTLRVMALHLHMDYAAELFKALGPECEAPATSPIDASGGSSLSPGDVDVAALDGLLGSGGSSKAVPKNGGSSRNSSNATSPSKPALLSQPQSLGGSDDNGDDSDRLSSPAPAQNAKRANSGSENSSTDSSSGGSSGTGLRSASRSFPTGQAGNSSSSSAAAAEPQDIPVTYLGSAAGCSPVETVPPVSPFDLCRVCLPGTYSTSINSSECLLCAPGQFAAGPGATSCDSCPAGSATFAWGSAVCRPCLPGTFAPRAGSSACDVCPAGTTTLQTGGRSCTAASSVPTGGVPGSGSTTGQQYALLVEFQLLLNVSGGQLDLSQLSASTTGINADSGESIMKLLIVADTAEALRIPPNQVRISALQQMNPSTFLVNVSATLPIGGVGADGAVPTIESTSNSKEVDADDLIEQLVDDPTRKYQRTTEATGAQVHVSLVNQQVVALPRGHKERNIHAIIWPAIGGTLLLAAVVAITCGRCFQRRRRALSMTISLPPLVGELGGFRLTLFGSKDSTSPPPSYVYYSTELELQELQQQHVAAAAAAAAAAGGPSTRFRPRNLVGGSNSKASLQAMDAMGSPPNAHAAQAAQDLQMFNLYYREGMQGARI